MPTLSNQNLMEINRALNPRSTGDSIYANTGSPRRLTEDEEAIAEEEERERKRASDEVENVSEMLSVSESEAKEHIESQKTWMQGGTHW